MQALTERQQETLDMIRAFIDEHGSSPTRAEITDALGLQSVNSTVQHLQALERKGYIELLPRRSRNIRLLATADTRRLPLVGEVAAGAPILAEENIEDYYAYRDLFKPQADYLLRVKGMSMRDAGIEEGDLLAVHQTPEARHGQIVVARLDDEVTVKRLERRKRKVRLIPANPEFAPIEIDPKRHKLAIEGVVVGVIRTLR